MPTKQYSKQSILEYCTLKISNQWNWNSGKNFQKIQREHSFKYIQYHKSFHWTRYFKEIRGRLKLEFILKRTVNKICETFFLQWGGVENLFLHPRPPGYGSFPGLMQRWKNVSNLLYHYFLFPLEKKKLLNAWFKMVLLKTFIWSLVWKMSSFSRFKSLYFRYFQYFFLPKNAPVSL